jgi:putative transposase
MSIEYQGQRYYEAAELAGKPGLPALADDLNRRWGKDKPRKTKKELGLKGKGWMYPFGCLPKETQAALLAEMVKATGVDTTDQDLPQRDQAVPALPGFAAGDRPVVKLPPSQDCTDRQRNVAGARAAILAEVHRLERAGGGRERAIQTIVRLANAGELPEHLQRLVPVANDKANEKRTLSRRSLWRWLALEEAGRLAPKATREKTFDVPAWGPWLLKFYRQPQKPSLTAALTELAIKAPAEIERPSDGQARRWLAKLGNVERIKGRLGPRELRTVLPFTRRTTDGLWPMDIVLPDGHCFDAEVRHPFHGQPFRPEMTTYVDIATRRVVGWSVGLAESSALILDALRQMILTHGIPCIHYSDRGAYKAELFTDALTGILPRLGIEQAFSIAYNSQARGAIERLHQTLWVSLAKTLPTYIGAPMDKQAKQIAFKTTRKTGRGLLAFEDFLALCRERVDAYNATPHRSLGGLSPNEAWTKAVAEGWEPVRLDDDDLDELLPEVVRTVQRGEISLPWGRYFSADLREFHGDTVRVRYDLHDGERVWIRDMEGRLLATAIRDGNARPYMPESAIEHARDRREAGRLSRLERKATEIRQERRGLIEPIPEMALPPDLMLTKRKMEQRAYEIEAAEAVSTLPQSPVGGAVHSAMETRRAPAARPAPAAGVSTVVSMASDQADRDAKDAWWKERFAHYQAGGELTAEEIRMMNSWSRCADFKARRRRELNGEEPNWASYLIPVQAAKDERMQANVR